MLPLHEPGLSHVQPYVTRFLVGVCLLAVAAQAADPDLSAFLTGIETRYNHAKTLKVVFHESYTASGQAARKRSRAS